MNASLYARRQHPLLPTLMACATHDLVRCLVGYRVLEKSRLMEVPERLLREMGFSRRELEQALMGALAQVPHSIDGDEVRVEVPPGTVCLRLQRAPERRIGVLALPVTRLEFLFSGLDAARRGRFMRWIEPYLQRGGG